MGNWGCDCDRKWKEIYWFTDQNVKVGQPIYFKKDCIKNRNY